MTAKALTLADKIVILHQHFRDADLAHAFGGALALAWCTERARGTIDIDCNVFVKTTEIQRLLDALPQAVSWSEHDRIALEQDGQVRLFWGTTPIDLFVNTTEFHEQVSIRARTHSFSGEEIPFLACTDLAVFKAFFNRTKDWADIEAMLEMQTLDSERVIGVLTMLLGGDDERVTRFVGLTRQYRGG